MKTAIRNTVASISMGLLLAASSAATADPGQGTMDNNRDGGNNYTQQTDTLDFPQGLIYQLPDALARSAHARMVMLRAENTMTGTFQKMRFIYSRSEDYRKVESDEKAAYTAYTAARDAAMAKLVDDPAYKAVTDLRDELGERIENMQSVKGMTPQMIAPLAAEKMNYSRTASAMEAKALAEDKDVAAARDKFVAAGQKLAQAKANFEDSLHYNPDVEAARVAVEDARVAKVTTAAYTDGLLKTSRVALDYAYFLHRYDRATIGYPYVPYDYGYGGYGSYSAPYRYYGYGYK